MNSNIMCAQIINNKCADVNKNDTVGINISIKEFNEIVQSLVNKSKDIKFFRDTIFYINSVRVANTITKNNLENKYPDFIREYRKSIFKEALFFLEASFYKGGAFYCQKYDLFMGGKPHENSQYKIIDN